jgi:hypothetical protein
MLDLLKRRRRRTIREFREFYKKLDMKACWMKLKLNKMA